MSASGPFGTCAHCGLQVRKPRADEPSFCCLGCRLAHEAGAGSEHGYLEARLLFAAVLAMGVMTFSLVLYGDPLVGPGDAAAARLRQLFGFALAAFALPVFALLAPPLLRAAWRDLRAGVLRMEGLVSLGVLGSYGVSVANTVRGEGAVYYETATMLLVLLTLARRLEASWKKRGAEAARALVEFRPARAHRLEGETEEREVELEVLAIGDLVRVAPGELVPADLRVASGGGEVGAQHVTGESARVVVAPGHEVPAGAANGSSQWLGIVLRRGADDAVGKIRALLEAPAEPTRAERDADRLSRVLAVLAITLAVVAFGVHAAQSGLARGIEVALSILVVACPCALALATPLAVYALKTALLRRGVVVREPRALERVAGARAVLFDKTGTLALPERELEIAAADTLSARSLRSLVRASGHALGAGIADPDALRFDALELEVGAGARARVGARTMRVAAPERFDKEGLPWSGAPAAQRVAWQREAATLVAYAEEGEVRALARIGSALRAEAPQVIEGLRARGLAVEIVSGDRAAAVDAAAQALGVPARAACDPAQKLAALEDARARMGPVLFVGDGLNDAPVLRAADVGIALRSGAAAAREGAAIEWTAQSLMPLLALVDGARALRRVIRRNLLACTLYNAVALAIAALGFLHPLIAVLAMLVSSLALGARSRRFFLALQRLP